jgi:hypothetical protein
MLTGTAKYVYQKVINIHQSALSIMANELQRTLIVNITLKSPGL